MPDPFADPPDAQEFSKAGTHVRLAAGHPIVSARESELLRRIDQGLPKKLSSRLKTLNARRRAEELTLEELDELIRLGDEVERMQWDRAEALRELASLRMTSVIELMQSLGLIPASPTVSGTGTPIA